MRNFYILLHILISVHLVTGSPNVPKGVGRQRGSDTPEFVQSDKKVPLPANETLPGATRRPPVTSRIEPSGTGNFLKSSETIGISGSGLPPTNLANKVDGTILSGSGFVPSPTVANPVVLKPKSDGTDFEQLPRGHRKTLVAPLRNTTEKSLHEVKVELGKLSDELKSGNLTKESTNV